MNKKKFLENILQIHSISVATIDNDGRLSSRIKNIIKENSLKCGACKEIFPVQAIEIK